MEQFVLPLSQFDLALLPESARDTQSPEFYRALDDYFRCRFRDMRANGIVQVTPETLTVTWAERDFDPVKAAVALCRRGQVRDGVQLLVMARQRRPDDPDLLLNLGIGLNELGEPQRAIPVLELLLTLDPGNVHGGIALGVAMGRVGDGDAALQLFARSVALNPANAWAQLNLGGMLLSLGRPAEARAPLEAAVQLAPDSAHAWFLLGEACAEVHDAAAARSAFEQSRRKDPHGPHGTRAEHALLRLRPDPLPRDADGINPDALAAMKWAIQHLRSLSVPAAQRLILQAAIAGQRGLRLNDSARIHLIEGMPQPLTGLEVAALIHAGVQQTAPGTPSGFPLDPEYRVATR